MTMSKAEEEQWEDRRLLTERSCSKSGREVAERMGLVVAVVAVVVVLRLLLTPQPQPLPVPVPLPLPPL
jgi:hypothetical protein